MESQMRPCRSGTRGSAVTATAQSAAYSQSTQQHAKNQKQHSSSARQLIHTLAPRFFATEGPRRVASDGARLQYRLAATAETRAGVDLEQKESCSAFLDSVKWSDAGLVAVIVQDVDTGEVLMQAYADRAGLSETLETRLATFYSRSRKGRWCKGETSGNYIRVQGVYLDCDRDSVVYLGEPDGPSCHTGAHTCWFSQAAEQSGEVVQAADEEGRGCSPLPTILALEETIQQRRLDSDSGKKSWTAKLLKDEALLCSKIREEAGELCQSAEEAEGKDRVASEMADLLYHSMVLLNSQGVSFKDVCKVLRSRFGTSGIEEKRSRPPKTEAQ